MSILSYLLDIAFVLVVIATALVVRRQSLVESAFIFLAVLIAGLVSLNFFEAISGWYASTFFSLTDIPVTKFLWSFVAIVLFLGVFGALFAQFQRGLQHGLPQGRRAESIGPWVFGLSTGYVLAAFLLTVFHTLPGPRDFWGLFEPDARYRSGPVMAFAPDYQFLTLVEIASVPRSPFSGTPWSIGGPLRSAELRKGHWASFPIRYSLWRENLSRYAGEDFEDDVYDDEEPNESADEDGDPELTIDEDEDYGDGTNELVGEGFEEDE